MSDDDKPKKDGDAPRVERRRGSDRRGTGEDRRGGERIVTTTDPRRQKPDRRKN